MARPYNKLRALLLENDFRQEHVARQILRSRPYVSTRMCAKESWEIEDAYKILDWLGIPREKIFEYFPPGGQNEPGCKRGEDAHGKRKFVLKAI